jgi:hypothetical protein
MTRLAPISARELQAMLSRLGFRLVRQKGSHAFWQVFESAELSYLLTAYENDDLRIELKVGKAGQEYSPIDQLSAGQRCTAVFPMLLRM